MRIAVAEDERGLLQIERTDLVRDINDLGGWKLTHYFTLNNGQEVIPESPVTCKSNDRHIPDKMNPEAGAA
jgi:hypothetical protein